MRACRSTVICILSILFAASACGPTSGYQADDGGTTPAPDAGPSCTEGQTQCFGQVFQTCEDGAFRDTATCTPPQMCVTPIGCAECIPGSSYCVGNAVHQCTADGHQGPLVEECSNGLQCSAGQCRDLCEEAAETRSYIGCEYWAIDLDNAIEVISAAVNTGFGVCPGPPFGAGGDVIENVPVCYDGTATQGLCDPGDTCPTSGFSCQSIDICGYDAQHSPFAVVVSNPHTFAVTVTIDNASGTTHTAEVPAGAVQKLYPQELGFPDQSIDGSGISASAYRIRSNAPIVAYQFNPLDNEDVFSNDGSLLIPRTTFDTAYYALLWPTLNRRFPPASFPPITPTNDYNGYVAVVAWEDGTEIRVTPRADVRLGNSFSSMSAGSSQTFVLNAFEVLNLEADNTAESPEQDLSGSRIEAVNGSTTFGVFAGHEAIVIQNTANSCCADHVEEMMFPASTWGDAYALARSESRGQNEPDLLRILAQSNGTSVSFDPPPSSGSCPTLNAGDSCDVQVMGDVEVSSNQPIMIGHYLLSVIDGTTGAGSGDPALALAVPIEQFRSTYAFLVPAEYDQQYVSIVAAQSTAVILDGNDVTSRLTPFASGAYKAARIEVSPGQHKVDCPGGCGIEVYGYSEAVSYLFAGGLDLEQIVID